MQNLVDNDQTGFLKGRSIAENICLINNVISYTESKNIPGLLLFVDFEKTFDTIEWAFVEKTLHHFGFGSSLIKWINLFYRDIQSCVKNNGWSAGFFELSRGLRQGCPLSPYIFILYAEVLATTIRKDNGLKGITVGSTECKLSQYADDTTLILDGTQKSLGRSFARVCAGPNGVEVCFKRSASILPLSVIIDQIRGNFGSQNQCSDATR